MITPGNTHDLVGARGLIDMVRNPRRLLSLLRIALGEFGLNAIEIGLFGCRVFEAGQRGSKPFWTVYLLGRGRASEGEMMPTMVEARESLISGSVSTDQSWRRPFRTVARRSGE